MTDALQVFVTIDTEERAAELAARLLEARVAGCVQVIGPVRSSYWWEGKIETSREWLCIAKTTAAGYPGLEHLVRASHPYQVPEILALPVATGNPDYLDWLTRSMQAG